jgi:hypothetical protein
MDARIFQEGSMGLGALVRSKPQRYRSPRVAQWYEGRKAHDR